jgi:hypothetical protein
MYSDGVINWMKVSKVADGVEICPVQPSLRDDPKIEWYYNWDVASGCIWRPSGLMELVLVAQR